MFSARGAKHTRGEAWEVPEKEKREKEKTCLVYHVEMVGMFMTIYFLTATIFFAFFCHPAITFSGVLSLFGYKLELHTLVGVNFVWDSYVS